MPPVLISLITAELFVILVRNREMLVICRSAKHRSTAEQEEMDHGLFRSIVLEFFLFVPASVVLIFLALRPFLLNINAVAAFIRKSSESHTGFYALMGIVSYGFPFAAVRRTVTVVALTTLRNFAKVVVESESSKDSDKSSERSAVM